MQHADIQRLRRAVEATYGRERVRLYGSSEEEENGTCFIIDAIPVSFSVVLNEEETHEKRYNVQVESHPPGEWVHTDYLEFDDLLALIAAFRGPTSSWPI